MSRTKQDDARSDLLPVAPGRYECPKCGYKTRADLAAKCFRCTRCRCDLRLVASRTSKRRSTSGSLPVAT